MDDSGTVDAQPSTKAEAPTDTTAPTIGSIPDASLVLFFTPFIVILVAAMITTVTTFIPMVTVVFYVVLGMSGMVTGKSFSFRKKISFCQNSYERGALFRKRRPTLIIDQFDFTWLVRMNLCSKSFKRIWVNLNRKNIEILNYLLPFLSATYEIKKLFIE